MTRITRISSLKRFVQKIRSPNLSVLCGRRLRLRLTELIHSWTVQFTASGTGRRECCGCVALTNMFVKINWFINHDVLSVLSYSRLFNWSTRQIGLRAQVVQYVQCLTVTERTWRVLQHSTSTFSEWSVHWTYPTVHSVKDSHWTCTVPSHIVAMTGSDSHAFSQILGFTTHCKQQGDDRKKHLWLLIIRECSTYIKTLNHALKRLKENKSCSQSSVFFF